MSHRLQITISDSQYAELKRESAKSGVSIAEMIRRKLGGTRVDRRAVILELAGSWPEAPDGKTYVESIRRGLGNKYKERGYDLDS